MGIRAQSAFRRLARCCLAFDDAINPAYAADAETPKRWTHFRAESPPSDAFKTRSRKSMPSAQPIKITLYDGIGESETSRIVTVKAIQDAVDMF